MAFKKVYDDNFKDLVKILPMNDAIFIANLKTNGLLEGDTSEQIDNQGTKADKAKYFLQNVIEPGLAVGDTETFDKFVTVMEKSERMLLEKRARKIRSELAGTYVNNFLYLYVQLFADMLIYIYVILT